jgi:hypothetical protein
MRRLLALVFILLVPLQSSLAAAVSMAGMPNSTCEQAPAAVVRQPSGHSAAMNHSPTGCIGSGLHGSSHGHCCLHSGGFAMAVASATLSMDSSASPVRQVEHAPFGSIVLDVPLPPPTGSA